MNALIKIVVAQGYNAFIQILSIGYYKEFVESVVLFYSIHQNAEYIKTSVSVDLLLATLTKHNLLTREEAQTLSSDENDKQMRMDVRFKREEYLLELMKTKSPDFHRSAFYNLVFVFFI